MCLCQISVQFLEAPKLVLIKGVYKSVPAPCGGNRPDHKTQFQLFPASQFVFTFICSLFHFCFFRKTVPFLLPSFALFCPLRPSFSSYSFLFLPSRYLVCSLHLPSSFARWWHLAPLVLAQSVGVIFFFFYLCNVSLAFISIQQHQHGVMTMFSRKKNPHDLSSWLSGIYGSTQSNTDNSLIRHCISGK